MKPFNNLIDLKSYLNIASRNTGNQFNYRGIVFDDIEGLQAITSADGSCVHLHSYLKDTHSLKDLRCLKQFLLRFCSMFLVVKNL